MAVVRASLYDTPGAGRAGQGPPAGSWCTSTTVTPVINPSYEGGEAGAAPVGSSCASDSSCGRRIFGGFWSGRRLSYLPALGVKGVDLLMGREEWQEEATFVSSRDIPGSTQGVVRGSWGILAAQ